MFSTKKIVFAALFAMFVAFGSVQAQDAFTLAAPETDYGRDGSYNIDVVPGATINANGNYGAAVQSGSRATPYVMPETDYGRAHVWDQGSRGSAGGGSIEASMPVTDRYSYSESH